MSVYQNRGQALALPRSVPNLLRQLPCMVIMAMMSCYIRYRRSQSSSPKRPHPPHLNPKHTNP
jgi:hypothetical protein